MNGRMYDPLLGRMLSPDNVIHDPTGTQYYNRYSYAFNNPLKFTDPTGWDGDDGDDGDDDDDDDDLGIGDPTAAADYVSPLATPSYDFAGNDLNSSTVNYNSNGNANSIASISGEPTPEVNLPNSVGSPSGLLPSMDVSGSSYFDPTNTTGGIIATIDAPSFTCNVPVNLNPYSDFPLLQTSTDGSVTASLGGGPTISANTDVQSTPSTTRTDYYNINFSLSFPNPYMLGIDISLTLDKYGTLYLSPGISWGTSSLTFGSGSLTQNTLLQNDPPTQRQLESFLSGWSLGWGGGAGLGTGMTVSPFSNGGTIGAVNNGQYTPQFGANLNYTPSFFIWRDFIH